MDEDDEVVTAFGSTTTAPSVSIKVDSPSENHDDLENERGDSIGSKQGNDGKCPTRDDEVCEEEVALSVKSREDAPLNEKFKENPSVLPCCPGAETDLHSSQKDSYENPHDEDSPLSNDIDSQNDSSKEEEGEGDTTAEHDASDSMSGSMEIDPTIEEEEASEPVDTKILSLLTSLRTDMRQLSSSLSEQHIKQKAQDLVRSHQQRPIDEGGNEVCGDVKKEGSRELEKELNKIVGETMNESEKSMDVSCEDDDFGEGRVMATANNKAENQIDSNDNEVNNHETEVDHHDSPSLEEQVPISIVTIKPQNVHLTHDPLLPNVLSLNTRSSDDSSRYSFQLQNVGDEQKHTNSNYEENAVAINESPLPCEMEKQMCTSPDRNSDSSSSCCIIEAQSLEDSIGAFPVTMIETKTKEMNDIGITISTSSENNIRRDESDDVAVYISPPRTPKEIVKFDEAVTASTRIVKPVPLSPSMMSFTAIKQMWEEREVKARMSTKGQDIANSWSHEIHVLEQSSMIESAPLFSELQVVQGANRIVATEFVDDKPSLTEPELDCDDDDELELQSCTSVNNLKVSTTPSDEKGSILSGKHDSKRRHFTLFESKTLSSNDSCSSTTSMPSSEIPDPTKILATGMISIRTSLRTMVMKKWKKCAWIRYGATSLLIFRSEEDGHNWVRNPFLSPKQRNFLVKLRIDFLEDMSKAHTRGHRMTPMKAKVYERNGPLMHNFKLERWTDLGSTIVAAFASAEKEEINVLREALEECLHNCPENGLRSIQDLIIT